MPTDIRPLPRSARSAGGVGLSLVALIGLHGAVAAPLSDGRAWLAPARGPDEVLLVLLGWVGMVLAGWLALGSALTLLSASQGAVGRWCGRMADRLTPLLVRRLLTVALGTSAASVALPAPGVVGTAAAPTPAAAAVTASGTPVLPWVQTAAVPSAAHATVVLSGRSAQSGPGVVTVVDPGPGYRPTPPAAAAAPRAGAAGTDPGFRPTHPLPRHDGTGAGLLAPAPRPEAAALDTVTVRRGDTLWSIAARHLGPGATDGEVAGSWPGWYAANSAVIGDDPDLIRPGLQLVPPRHGDAR